MFEVNAEGLTSTEAAGIEAIARRVAALARSAAGLKQGNRARWFGTQGNSAEVLEGLRSMDTYLNEKCKTITFVRKNTGQIVDSVPAGSSDYGQVIPNIASTMVAFRKTAKHVGAGLRLFAMNELIEAMKSGDTLEQLNYVYHEVSHKVLDTVDYAYGQKGCLALAVKTPARAVKNADNWGYFIAELA